MTNTSDPSPRLRHYEVLVETYRHHFDLFIKGFGLYLLIVSALAGFLFSDQSVGNRSGLSLFVTGVSIISLFGLRPCYQWVKDMQGVLGSYEQELGLEQLSLYGALGIIDVIRNGIIAIAVGGVICSALFYLNTGS